MEWVMHDKEIDRLPIMAWCSLDSMGGAIEQAINLANHPVVYHHIALMPDAGCGYGMPNGSVIATKDAIIPNAVGKDVNCGMRFVKTSIRVEDVFKFRKCVDLILDGIREFVPVGMGVWHKTPQENNLVLPGELFPVTKQEQSNLDLQIGTLGGGNHFIEIQIDEEGFLCFMIHCGSRNFGAKVCNYYNKEAKKLNKRWHSSVNSKWDLAFLPIGSLETRAYISEMKFAMQFALENRRIISEKVKLVFRRVLSCNFEPDIDVSHNYAVMENHFGENVWVHRKGATSAREGQIGIIPGSMGVSSYIVRGLGNKNSFMSCSHGAGRPRSCRKSNEILKKEDCDKAMAGISFSGWKLNKEGKPDLSEAPGAYKDINKVMALQTDLVEIVSKLKPLGVVKG